MNETSLQWVPMLSLRSFPQSESDVAKMGTEPISQRCHFRFVEMNLEGNSAVML